MKMTALFGKILMVLLAMSSHAGLAQGSSDQAPRLQNDPKEKIIKDYYAAYEKKDWNLMTPLLADGFTFTSPFDDHINVKQYKEKCWPNALNIKRFDVDKLVVNGDDAFVSYNGWTKDGKLFRNTEYFKFKDGKIKENECFFGPGVNFPNNSKK